MDLFNRREHQVVYHCDVCDCDRKRSHKLKQQQTGTKVTWERTRLRGISKTGDRFYYLSLVAYTPQRGYRDVSCGVSLCLLFWEGGGIERDTLGFHEFWEVWTLYCSKGFPTVHPYGPFPLSRDLNYGRLF